MAVWVPPLRRAGGVVVLPARVRGRANRTFPMGIGRGVSLLRGSGKADSPLETSSWRSYPFVITSDGPWDFVIFFE